MALSFPYLKRCARNQRSRRGSGYQRWPEDDSIFADAFVFTAANGMQNLNDLIKPGLNIQLFQADDINERGQILALGLVGSEQHSFLLTPITHVPDTGSAAVLFGSVFMIFVLLRTALG